MNPETELKPVMEWARDLAVKAGQQTLRYFRQNITVEWKADQSPVTRADQETERMIRQEIERAFPSHDILGEEFGERKSPAGSPWKWVVDPIDGTKSFIHGIPLYTVLLALMKDDRPVVGVIHNPVTSETVWAGTGLGAWCNGRPCRVSTQERLSEAWLQTTDPSNLLRSWNGAAELLESARYSRTWGDAYGYLLVATGRADVMVDAKMSLWDLACLKPIIEEAGGRLTDLDGNEALGDSALATNGRLHEQVLQLIKGKRTRS